MPRILIIDDEPCISETLSEFSKDLGYDPVHIDDPSFCSLPCQEGKSCPRATPCVDVILVDQYLPTLFGLDFVEELSRRGCKIPEGSKAIISGVLASQERERAQKLGYNVLLKPITFETLKNWLPTSERKVA